MANTEAAGLLFREEDLLWNCYFTIPKTRETGCLGSVLRTAVVSPVARERFIEMMKNALTDMLDARGIPYTKWSEYQTPRSRAKPGPKPKSASKPVESNETDFRMQQLRLDPNPERQEQAP